MKTTNFYSRSISKLSTSILVVIFIIFNSVSVFAQIANNPFSRIGLGDISSQSSISNLGMGGMGVSLPTVKSSNLQNPALLSYHKLTVFEAAGIGDYKDLKTNTVQTNDFGGSLGYLSLIFPVYKNMAINVGFQPFSAVNYDAVSYELLENTPTFVKYDYAGTGGVSQVFLGVGYKIIQNLSVGAQINYNFGAISNTSTSTLDDFRGSYIAQLTDRYNYNDFTYRLGLHYFIPVFDNSQINVGVSYDGSADFSATHFRAFERKTFGDVVIDGDTLLLDEKASITIPDALTFGISLQRGYLQAASGTKNTAYSFGVDYTIQDWSVANSSAIVGNNRLQSSSKISVGGEITPDVRSTNYLARTTYRAGFTHSQTPLVINDESIEDMSLSIGFSLPVKNNFSSLNMYGAIGKRGTLNTIQERYVKFGLGISISDRWFIRSRFD
ncbi:hypothetical protein Fleli_1664 [Bernardetia litoralis DSM 6794]|uniref:Long-chain fatty acid transport protein n=1 Tax=Bernardetia litoralis (strain ATCC 23117 / DSM 6794 / NBRC 15988 / NCIMB 1366 / Fx l1 / Sio-4) TaxID=880071 RepID=I4AJD9_BERLS|nr:hypothetical protein [Bernardetia litoralis]AFM04074.1 hypothetical protein Fleli_1664 [Bernardetia litoralis DSM 6794]